MRNVNCIEIAFTRHVDLSAVWYSETNNGLPNNNRFICQDNVATVNLIRESMCNVHVWISFGKRLSIFSYACALRPGNASQIS
jgi:hypothetical protein